MQPQRSVKTISAEDALRHFRMPHRPGHGLDETGRFLDIGRERIALAEIVRHTASGREEKDFISNFATAAVFAAGAAVFAVATAVYQWRDRFWIGAALLGLIALFALIDIGRLRWHRTYIFDLTLRDGTTRRFVTADAAVAENLQQALRTADGIRRG